ncbi:MAG: hypothetical protein M4579_004130 [Chaenotheca gracillima]|nr:MAG: hypothetical protein M4579_004130 [Chaenotheca gracillima]
MASPKPSPAPSIAPSTTSTELSTAPQVVPPPAAAVEKRGTDSGKLALFLEILKKFRKVTDIAAVRFSLPPRLLEPVPNLEYWNYLDRPEMFASIGDSDDALGRMLEVLRFWFTKDLKYVKGKPCKPYNSTLGEFFRCNWDVEDNVPPVVESSKDHSDVPVEESTKKPVKVSYLTEQTSHHPPVSAFYVDCPEKGITARGFDQLSASFSGTSIKVTAGEHNRGIFVTLHKRDDEQYRLTHPAATLGGFFRGSLNVTVADHCYIRCPKTKLMVILHYHEEGWLGKTQNRVEGVVFKYDPENSKTLDDEKNPKIKDVPEGNIVARIEGSWRDKLYYTVPNSDTKTVLIDLNPLFPVAKLIPPEVSQLTNESRRFWAGVTEAIKAGDFDKAASLKLELEQKQRDKATAREKEGITWRPRFFENATDKKGFPELSTDGKKALNGLHTGVFELDESAKKGA